MAVGAAQQQEAAGRSGRTGGPPSANALQVETLSDKLFVLRGGGGSGNTVAFITANGVTLVDTKLPGWGQPLLDKLKTLTDKPVTTIINTHTHNDHVSGNVEIPGSSRSSRTRTPRSIWSSGIRSPGLVLPARARTRSRPAVAVGCRRGRSPTG
jgi:glyoxylase-like metal-dependent hydrolase (beta-lactamase superfamily II)